MECPACGSHMRDEQRICLSCGELMQPRVAAPDRLQAVPAGVPAWIAFEARTNETPTLYGASRPARVLAFVVDATILGLAGWLLSLAVGGGSIAVSLNGAADVNWWVAGPLLAVQCAYAVVFPATSWQGTPGKRLLGMRIVTLEGEPLSIFQSAMRYVFQQLWLGAGVPLTIVVASQSPWAILPCAGVVATGVAFWMLCAEGRSPWDWMASTKVVD